MRILSIVSGTSTDGLSMAIYDISGTGLSTEFKAVTSRTFPYGPEMRNNLLSIASGENVTMQFISRVHWDLGRFIDRCASVLGKDFDAISFSGHTAHHGPSTGHIEEGTFQIGEMSIIAARTGKTSVYDFRATDMGYGGMGAPLTAVSDYFLLKEPGTLAINIGGIGNITYIGKGKLIAFDTGPGNMLIDLTAMKLFGSDYDRDGDFARKGSVNKDLLEFLLSDQYLKLKPPKNSGREYYNAGYLDKVIEKFQGVDKHDLIRTITRFTGASIYNQASQFIREPVKRLIVGGGGTLNPLIIKDLEELFGTEVLKFSDIGIDDMYRECLGFAVLANQTLNMEPGRLDDLPNLKGFVIGKIIPGKNFPEILRQIVHE